MTEREEVLDSSTLERTTDKRETLERNEVGRLTIQTRGPLVLDSPAAMSEVSCDDDQLWADTLDQGSQTALDLRFLRASGVQVGDVEKPHGQRRSRL